MPIYMNYDNLGVKGDVTADGHQDWIELNSFQWGVSRAIASPTGSNIDREGSAPSVAEISVTKAQDTATGKLLTEAYQGKGVKVVIDFCKTASGSGKLDTYIKYELEDTMISSYSLSSGGERPSESLTLNFATINCAPKVMNKDGKLADGDKVKYDIGQGKVV